MKYQYERVESEKYDRSSTIEIGYPKAESDAGALLSREELLEKLCHEVAVIPTVVLATTPSSHQ